MSGRLTTTEVTYDHADHTHCGHGEEIITPYWYGRVRPATRVDNTVILPDGRSRELTRWERLRLRLGMRVHVDPASARHTTLLGDPWRTLCSACKLYPGQAHTCGRKR